MMRNLVDRRDFMLEQNTTEYITNSQTNGRYAFVTFMIMNDSFLPGALMFAYGLRNQNCAQDIVCLVSGNISKGAVYALQSIFDKVICTDEIYVEHRLRHSRQDRPFLFSRFNALRLGKGGDLKQNYKKIILCDSDLLPIRDYSSLFLLNAPAGIINEYKENCITYDINGHYITGDAKTTGTWCWHEKYQSICPHGKAIPMEITDRVKQDYDNMGVNSSLWVLEPDMSEYLMIREDVKTDETKGMISHFKWPEMQYATMRWSGQWTNVDLKYSSFNGYPCLDILNGVHYAGTKPWKYKSIKHLRHFMSYPDYYYWYMHFISMMNTHNKLFSVSKLSRIYGDISQVLGDMY